ncbi:MAG: ParB/RepB/Spo0J family partition protein [Rheinheimera sp.]
MNKPRKSLSEVGGVSSMLTDRAKVEPNGQAMQFDVTKIHPDPDNREDIDQAEFAELVEDIGLVGVKSPVSVRTHPDAALAADGHYMLNFGHQRFAATLLNGLQTIPGFIDNTFTPYDRMKENLKRVKQSARDTVKFIKAELDKNVSKGDIAKGLGKSAAWVSQHVTLLKLPAPLAEVFGTKRCDDVTVMNDLARLYKTNGEAVDSWLADPEQEFTRGSVKLLAEFIETKTDNTEPGETDGADTEGTGDTEPTEKPQQKKEKETDPTKFKKAIVIVEYMGQSAQLVMTKRPSMSDNGWIKLDSSGEELEAPLAQLKLLELIEG